MILLSRIAIGACGMIVSVIGFASIRQSTGSTVEDSAPKRSFSFLGSHGVEALGACRIDVQSASCWNMDGKPDVGLTDQVTKGLKGPYGSRVLTYRDAKVFAVARASPDLDFTMRGQAKAGRNHSWSLGYGDSGKLMTIYGIEQADNPANLGELPLNAVISHVPTEYSLSLYPKVGERISAEGSSLTLGNVRAILAGELKQDEPYLTLYDRDQFVLYPREQFWRYTFAWTGPLFGWGCDWVALDLNGKPIQGVDLKGQPASIDLVTKESLPYGKEGVVGAVMPKAPGQRDHFPARFRQWYYTFVNGAYTVVSNVDPRVISKIQVRPTRTVQGKLGPFPLAPSSS
jgi:hypothetical protein